MKTLILIPARFASTRFPGKPLALISGKPMICHVIEKAKSVSEYTYVATDDQRIADCVTCFGGQAVMTSESHCSGTDRCYEAYRHVAKETKEQFDVVVNIQGDEPFILQEQIRSLVACFADPQVQIATLAKKFENNKDIFDSNKVKVVFSPTGTALYFSRSAIPYCRGIEPESWLDFTPFYKHVGMYAYRPQVLQEITALSQSILERAESLEQLRWLENGYKIAVKITEHESIGIDTPEDLERANQSI